jgi:diguanylate cyclase (GGDEF)-like protein
VVGQRSNWSAQQLAEFLAALGECRDENQAIRTAVERAAEALEAEVAAVVRGGAVMTSVGFPQGRVPADELAAVANGATQVLEVPGLGPGRALAVTLDETPPAALVLARAAEDGFLPEEVSVVRGMARVLSLTLRTLRVLDAERRLRARLEAQAEENARLLASLRQRQRLLEKTSAIHRLILRRRPLREVLEAITHAASELLGAEVAALRMIDEEDPASWVMAASTGATPEQMDHVRRGPIGIGAGGRAIAEGQLIVIDGYRDQPDVVPVFADSRLETAIAAPVHERDRVVGSLTVASYVPDRTFDDADKEMLRAFAEHVSLALLDAKTVELMSHQALHDSLTGLPNRVLFLDRLHHSLERAARRGGSSAVLFIDLDRFKTVNDSLGHALGDEVLRTVAERLGACVRAEDTAARLGGDEFAVLADGLSESRHAAVLAERIIAALEVPLVVDGSEVMLTASIGIALGSRPDDDLLRNADVAMYRAKATGGSFEFFEAGMRAAIVERVALETDLRRAVERSQLRLHYQPIVDLMAGRVVGLEALVRWQHPSRGLLLPAEFVGLAEETGSIVPLGCWVLREACAQATEWERRDIGVSVNVSLRQLGHANLLADVAAAIEDSGLDPGGLTLEITETFLVGQDEAALARLKELKSLGVRLALDDFGVGYSSLRYLTELPFDVIKIPKSFVDAVGSPSPSAISLVQTILNLGRALDLAVVAEGIETADQLVRLRSLGCELGQGFLFARPAEPPAVVALLDESLLPLGVDRVRAA